MRFTLPKSIHSNAKNLSTDKEMVRALSVIVNTKNGPKEVATVRWYMGRSSRASVVHCSIWLKAKGMGMIGGHDTAGGWGYCKKSAAFAGALSSAGVDVSESANGRGMSVVREQLLALTKALGYSGRPLVIEH